MRKITKHFTEKELNCNCGCGSLPSTHVAIILELVRLWANSRHNGTAIVKINSAARCVQHNEKVQEKNDPDYTPYSSKSRHMPTDWHDPNGNSNSDAVDVQVKYKTKTIGFMPAVEQVPAIEVFEFLDDLFPNSLGLIMYDW